MNPMGVTFREFIQYVVEGNERHFDFHWTPMTRLCNLCNIEYNVVEKMETLERDHYFLLNSVGQQSRYPDIAGSRANQVGNSTQNTRDRIIHYFSALDKDLLRGLERVYKDDFDLFGYTPHFKVKEKRIPVNEVKPATPPNQAISNKSARFGTIFSCLPHIFIFCISIGLM